VAGCHQIDVGRASFLQPQHQALQLRTGQLSAHPLAAELAVLAVPALQGAAGEEDRSRSVFSDQGRLLPPVQAGPGDPHPGTFPAVSLIPLQAVDPAIPWTESAFRVQIVRPVGMRSLAVHPVGKFYRAGVS
jgi:hypothetical protein